MTSIADGSVIIQTSAESVPSTPSWFGEVVLLAGYLRKHGDPDCKLGVERSSNQEQDDGSTKEKNVMTPSSRKNHRS
jgi:hypothetical protein